MIWEKKYHRFEISDDNKLNLNKLGLLEKDVLIFDFAYSIEEFLESTNDIVNIKKMAHQFKDKIIFIILRENFYSDHQDFNNISNINTLYSKFKKVFKKEKRVFAFIKNTYNLEVKDQVDIIDTINVMNEEFSSDVNRTLEEIEQQKQLEQKIAKLREEEILQEKERLTLDEKQDKEQRKSSRKQISFLLDDDLLLGEKSFIEKKLSNYKIEPNAFDAEFEQKNKDQKDNNFTLNNSDPYSREYGLKSVFDFIWKMFIIYSKENQLDILLYDVVSHTSIISYGQNDLIRDLAQDSDSLFDLIYKLDYELEFNNNLFYLYLANLYYVKNNRIKVNMKFVDGFMIWENQNSRETFIKDITKFINENTNLLDKVIYSHFIEYGLYIKSFIARIGTTISYQDIYRIICVRNETISKFNIFRILFKNLNFICSKLELDLYNLILNQEAIDQLNSDFEINIIKTYNVLLDEIRNLILFNISTEENINMLYKELTNIGVNYLVDFIQNINNYELKENDTLSSLITHDQELNEKDYLENNLAIFDDEEKIANAEDLEESSNFNNKGNKLSKVKNFFNKNKENVDNDFENEPEYLENDYIDLSSDEDEKYNKLMENEVNDKLVCTENSDIKSKIDEYEKIIKSNIELLEQERKKIKENLMN